MNEIEKLYYTYHRYQEGVAFCQYLICTLVAHSDHQHGKITGLAIDKGIHIAYAPKQNGPAWLLQSHSHTHWQRPPDG